jgi:hypothetical protein
MRSPSQYQLSGGLSITAVDFPSPSEIALTLSSPLQNTEVYTLTVTAADCQGNTQTFTRSFAVPAPPKPTISSSMKSFPIPTRLWDFPLLSMWRFTIVLPDT